MRGPGLVAIWAAVLAFAPLSTQAQGIRFHGIPASATSPGPNGELHGIPASVTSPTFDNQHHQGRFFGSRSVNQQRRFVRDQRGRRMVVVPVYIPGYSLPYYMYEPEQAAVAEEQPADNTPAVAEPPARTIFERRSTTVADYADDDATDSRYGEHYLDYREERRHKPAKTQDAEAAKATDDKQIAEARPDSLPSTVLIFKDGHRSEIHDYAIVGENLFDLGTVHVMKKIPLAMLDIPATRKENEQNGIDFRLP